MMKTLHARIATSNESMWFIQVSNRAHNEHLSKTWAAFSVMTRRFKSHAFSCHLSSYCFVTTSDLIVQQRNSQSCRWNRVHSASMRRYHHRTICQHQTKSIWSIISFSVLATRAYAEASAIVTMNIEISASHFANKDEKLSFDTENRFLKSSFFFVVLREWQSAWSSDFEKKSSTRAFSVLKLFVTN